MLEWLESPVLIGAFIVFALGYWLGSLARGSSKQATDFDMSKISPAARADIESSLQKGAKIDAIRTLRTDTGLGLKDAKSVIDRWGQ